MKAMIKKFAIGAAAAAMAMSAVGMTASAVEKHPGESGYCYYENQQAEVNCEDQPGIEDPDVLYGKHFCMASIRAKQAMSTQLHCSSWCRDCRLNLERRLSIPSLQTAMSRKISSRRS